MNTIRPRTALIGGFRKTDVLAYVEQISVGYQNEIAALKKQLADADSDRVRAVSERDAAVAESGETDRLRNGLRASYEELTTTKMSLEDSRSALVAAQNEAAELRAALETEKAARTEAAQNEAAARAEAAALSKELANLKNALNAANTGIEERNAIIAERDETLSAKNGEIRRLNESLNQSLNRAGSVAESLRRAAEQLEKTTRGD